jgi:hypothetical protein
MFTVQSFFRYQKEQWHSWKGTDLLLDTGPGEGVTFHSARFLTGICTVVDPSIAGIVGNSDTELRLERFSFGSGIIISTKAIFQSGNLKL